MRAIAFNNSREIRAENNLLRHGIQMLYGSEKLNFAGMTRMIKNIINSELKSILQHHLEETGLQIERLERIGHILNIDVEGEGSYVMKSLIAEGEKLLQRDVSDEYFNLALIAEIQKIEHHEILVYTAIECYAQELGLTEAAALLHETLEEEKATDLKLCELAKMGAFRWNVRRSESLRA